MNLDKILNNKWTWVILGSIIVILLILVIFIQKKDGDINNGNFDPDEVVDIIDNKDFTFELKGNDNITIYVNDEYIEYGFLALDSLGNDIKDSVIVESNVDTKKSGIYEVIYKLTYDNKEKELKRIVNVIETNDDDILLTLNGEEVVYLNIDEKYNEVGAKLLVNNKDLSDNVKIDSNVVSGTVGNYKVTYSYNNKTVVRQVIVFNLDSFFKVNKSTNSTLININVDDNIKYVIMPDHVVNTNKVISYEVKSGTYVFDIYTNNLKKYTKSITVSASTIENKDTTAPNGTCNATLKNSKTIFSVSSSDNDIKSYNYSGLATTTKSTYTLSKYVRNSFVTLTDTSGNSRKITCTTKIEALPVITPQSGESVKYTSESNTLKVYISKKNGWFITRIWAYDPVYQLKKNLIDGGGGQKDIEAILRQTVDNSYKDKIVVAFNASYYNADLYKRDNRYKYEPTALLIQNGKVLLNDYDKYVYPSLIYYIDGSNQLKYINSLSNKTVSERKSIFQSVIDSGAYNTFSFEPVLVENGVAATTYNKKASYEYNAYRQGICQVDSNNFILVSSDTAQTGNTVIFAEYLKSLGCKTAFNLDGGGSVKLLYKPKGTTEIMKLHATSRSHSSVMYFTELD